MPTFDRKKRIESYVKRIAGNFLLDFRERNVIISVTRAIVSDDLKEAMIFLSIFPEEKEEKILAVLKKDEKKFKEYVKSRLKIRCLPVFGFKPDNGLKNEQRIEELLKKAM